eukprot:1156925-Pelagomonas_calceolata.AAC.2
MDCSQKHTFDCSRGQPMCYRSRSQGHTIVTAKSTLSFAAKSTQSAAAKGTQEAPTKSTQWTAAESTQEHRLMTADSTQWTAAKSTREHTTVCSQEHMIGCSQKVAVSWLGWIKAPKGHGIPDLENMDSKMHTTRSWSSRQKIHFNVQVCDLKTAWIGCRKSLAVWPGNWPASAMQPAHLCGGLQHLSKLALQCRTA